MRRILSFFLIVCTFSTMAQAPTCAQGDPFCTGTNYDFPATANSSTAESGPSYGCLYSQPNPAWYYLQISNTGSLTFNIAGSGGYDVDFCCWGPFTSQAGICSQLTSGNIVDCSYSASATETCNIPSAVAGQWYMVLITNFSNQPQNIQFSQTGGSGSTNCNIVNCGVTANNTGPYCVGQTATLNAATTNTTATTYSWTGPGGFSSTQQSPTIANSTTATAGVYTVTGTTSGTVTCVATTTVVVNSSAPPSVTSATICQGNSGTITASGATSYAWNTGDVTASITQSPASTTVYTVTGTTGNCTAQNTGTITVLPNPTVTVNSSTICVGQGTATLTATGASTYLWSSTVITNTFALTNGATSTETVTPNATTQYFVIGGTSICTDTAITTVIVNPLPTITTTNGTMCVTGGPGASLGASGASTYTWSPNSFLSNPNISNPVATPPATTTYSVSGTDNNGCISQSTATATVYPLPTFTTTAPPVCLNDNLIITVNPPTFASYTVQTFPIYVTTTMPINIPATQTINATFNMVVADNNGCVNTGTFAVAVNPLPVITASATPVCLGSSGMLMASGAGTLGTYTWSPSTGLSSVNGNGVYVTPAGLINVNYNVIGTDLNGCSGAASVNVQVNDLPNVTISPDTVKGCVPQCAIYTVTSNVPPAASGAYNWTYSNAGASTVASPTVCYNVVGNSTVKLVYTDINGCKNTNFAHILTYSIPKADFDYQPKPATILAPNITFQNLSYNPMGGVLNYSWNFGDTLIDSDSSNAVNPTYLYQNPGDYTVTLIAASKNGCVDTTLRVVVIQNDFALYVPDAFTPNGDGKNETFKALGEGIFDYVINIYDRWGNQVFTTTNIEDAWNGSLNNHGNVLQNDVYVWRIHLRTIDHKGHSYAGTVTLLR